MGGEHGYAIWIIPPDPTTSLSTLVVNWPDAATHNGVVHSLNP